MNDDWSDLSKTWAEPEANAPPLDTAFVRALIRRDRLARINYLMEAGGCVVVVGVIAWAVIVQDLPWMVAAAAGGFAAFALALTVWSRRGDPGLLLDTPDAALRSALAQARIGLRWAWAGVAICVAAVGFLIIMAVAAENATTAAVIGAPMILAVVPFYLRHARNCRRRIEAHEAALAALDRIEGDADSHTPDPVASGG